MAGDLPVSPAEPAPAASGANPVASAPAPVPEVGPSAPGAVPAAEPAAPATPGAAPSAPALTRWQRRERAAADALRTFVRDVHEARFGAVAPRSPEIRFDLHLRARPGEAWALTFDPPLADQIAAQLEDARALLGVYREGRVFCHKCESSDCAHAAPPTPLAVFAGYDPMGMPEWKELLQALIEARDERVDRLFDRSPRVLARLQLGRDLRARQLAEFGRASATYSILGQVVAGYFAAPGAPGADAAGRVALTFQAVETRGPRGGREVRLNTLGVLPDGRDLDEWLGSDAADWIGRARDEARRALDGLARTVAGGGSPDAPGGDPHRALGRVPLVLRRLAESLERGRRQEDRRTRHVEQRRHDRRPVPKAWEDLAGAKADAFFRDEKESTLVVCGPQGRAHVFNDGGRHVTSFVLQPGGADFRLRTGRWTAADAAAVEALRRAVQSRNDAADAPLTPD